MNNIYAQKMLQAIAVYQEGQAKNIQSLKDNGISGLTEVLNRFQNEIEINLIKKLNAEGRLIKK